MTTPDHAAALAYLRDLRKRRDALMREGFHPQSLNDQEAGAMGVLHAMGVDTAALAAVADKLNGEGK